MAWVRGTPSESLSQHIGRAGQIACPCFFNRHPTVENLFVHELEGAREGALGVAAEARRAVTGVLGFDPPTWEDLPGVDDDGNMWQRRRWSINTGRRSHRAQVRSQAGPGADMALSAAPTHYLTRIPPHLFRVVLLRRLRFPLPLSLHTCRCGCQIDKFGHIVCTSRRRVCREANGSFTTNVMVRDLDLGDPQAADGRRLEVVVDGLHLFGGCQLAVDATVVSALHCDGSPHRGAENMDGVVLQRARRKKEGTHPELVGLRRRLRIVVLGVEVGGRMSTETISFLSQLAKARARQKTTLRRRRAEQAWRIRWGAILACATAGAVATSFSV